VPNESRSWLGFAGEATVHVWGRLSLDQGRQELRLTDLALDVESEAALVRVAARAAKPYVEGVIAENAVVDLRPFASSARRSFETALADFRTSRDDVRVDAAITELRLVDIAFDSSTLRLIAEADGSANVTVMSLPPR
jgi:hypothetical protein